MVGLPEQGKKIKLFGSIHLVLTTPAVDLLDHVGRPLLLGVCQRVERDQSGCGIGAVGQSLYCLSLQHVVELLAWDEHCHGCGCGWCGLGAVGVPLDHDVTLPQDQPT